MHGWSYGGYLALVALTRWPEMFASGSSHAGMSDLGHFFAETETWMAAASVTEYGDPVTDAALLQRPFAARTTGPGAGAHPAGAR